MACRWRIRHKLMIGLGVVIAIIGLLLAAAFLGLGSFRSTMHLVDNKLDELQDANDLRISVLSLARSGSIKRPQEADAELRSGLIKVRGNLEKYTKRLEESIQQGRALDQGYTEKLQVQKLQEFLDKLEQEIAIQVKNGAPQISGGSPLPLAETPRIKDLLDKLVRTSDDLSIVIYDLLDKRIGRSKKDYNLSYRAVAVISVVGVLLLIGLLGRFYCWAFNPIRELQKGAEQVAKGDFEHRLEVHSRDELQDVAEAFNHMTEKLRASFADLSRQVNERSRQLVRSERLASVGFLAAGVAHEINNPLASIVFCSEALEARMAELLDQAQQVSNRKPVSTQDRETMSRYLKMIQNEAMRCKEITQRLLEFSRSGEKRREPVDLNEVTQGVLDVVQHLQNCKGKNIVFHPSIQLIAWVNAQEIKSVVLNLVVNAMESMDEGGTLTITQRQQEGMAEIIFQDTGCGMPREVLDNIFEPFFTRSKTGKGTGLGLSISHRVITQHGGEIEASSPGPNRGSTFVVRLPLKPTAEELAKNSGPGQNANAAEETYYLRKFAA